MQDMRRTAVHHEHQHMSQCLINAALTGKVKKGTFALAYPLSRRRVDGRSESGNTGER
jgi:hypothetical protein